MTAFKITAVTLGAVAALGLSPASAHPGHGLEPGFIAGVAHYFSGVDHIAASLAAGLLGAVLTKRWIGALLWLGAFAISFGLYHEVAFFRTLQMNAFDAGFMISALGVMFAAYAISKSQRGRMKRSV